MIPRERIGWMNSIMTTGHCQDVCTKCGASLPEGAAFCCRCGAKVTAQTQQRDKKTKSRGNGMGSVYKRGKSWYAERTLGYRVDDDGKMRRQMIKKGGFPTKKAAIEYLPQLVSAAAAKKPITFSQMYDAWEPTHQATKSTMDCYRAAYKYFKPVWHFPFDQIDIDDLQACMDECDKGKRTRQNMKALCGLLYKYAIPRRAATINMGQYLIVGSGETLERCGIPLEDLRRLENAVGQIKYADYVVAQCYLGFRPSELLALDVLNYDRKGKTFQGGAKTEAGKNRIVPVADKIQPIIDRLVRDRVSGPVFCREGGQPMRIEDYRDIFYKVLDGVGINNPYIGEGDMRRHMYTPHSCRHTFATMLKNTAGADKDKMKLIGHSSAEMLRYYQDTDTESLRRIVNSF